MSNWFNTFKQAESQLQAGVPPKAIAKDLNYSSGAMDYLRSQGYTVPTTALIVSITADQEPIVERVSLIQNKTQDRVVVLLALLLMTVTLFAEFIAPR